MAENDELVTYIKRAFELREQECYKQAIEMLYKAITIEPDNTEIMLQLGELYYMLCNYPRATQYAEQILEQDNNNLQALLLMKNIKLKQGDLYSAKEIAEKILELNNSDKSLEELIDIYGKLELFDEIEKLFSKIEQNETCLYLYAKNLYKSSDIDKAEQIVNKVLEINPENESSLILKGKILFDKNKTSEAKEIFSKFGKYTQNAEILNYLGLFAMDELNFTEAIKLFSKAVNTDKKISIYHYNLGNAYFLNGWVEEAVNAYKDSIILNPENTQYRYSLAYIYYENKEYDKAEKEVEYIFGIDEKHPSARVLKALLLYNKGNFIEAENLLISNIKSGIEDEFTLSSLAKIEAELGKYGQAEKHLTKIIEKTPDNIGIKCDLGEVYIKEKKYDKALSIAKDIIENNPTYIPAYITGANAANLSGQYDIEKQYAQEMLSLDINCSDGYYYLALARKQENDYEEAIECMKRAIMHDLSNAKYYAQMAELYKLSGDNQTAFEYIKEAESINSTEEYRQLFREYALLARK